MDRQFETHYAECPSCYAEVQIDVQLPNINWRPIAELPEELKDGRTSWFWCDCGECGEPGDSIKCRWAENYDCEGWICDWGYCHNPTHFCEINGPEGK